MRPLPRMPRTRLRRARVARAGRRLAGAAAIGTLAAAIGALAATAAGGVARVSITERRTEIALPADSLRIDLPDRWIQPGSVVALWGADTLRPGADFSLEPSEGILEFRALPDSGTVEIRYEVIPIAVGRVFHLPVRFDAGSSSAAVLAPREGGIRRDAGRARLDLRGSKTVSLEVGSAQDLTVRQSLDVALSGEIAPGVTVRGILSDRATPLAPEGRTTELADLDRILLEVEGRSAGMTLGDFALRGPAGRYSAVERQLEGLRLTGRGRGATATAVAARVPGVYSSFEFLGEEGKQGPYILRPARAPIDALIVAGSERIWLDGELLVRGEDRDYSIDYAASTVSFSGRRIITGASRITVDCQVSAQAYRRQAYMTDLSWTRAAPVGGAGISLTATYYAEQDDRSSPVGGALTAEEKEALRAAGDSLTVDLASGVECGEVGFGDYIVVEADAFLPVHFRYVGAGEGTCKVRFDDAGAGKGDYADSTLSGGNTIYRYIGSKRGRFLPGRAVPRPQRRDLLDISAGGDAPAGFRYDAEIAGSLDDPNTYSSRDDGDRTGGALRLRIARPAEPLSLGGRRLGKWGAEVSLDERDARFRAPGRLDPGWFGYDWGVDGARLENGQSRRRIALRHEPGGGWSAEGGLETLENRRDLEASQRRLQIRRAGNLFGSAEWSRTRTEDRAGGPSIDGERRVDGLAIGARRGPLEAGAGLRREANERGEGGLRSGDRFEEWRASAAARWSGERGRFAVSRADRRDRTLAGSGSRASGRAVTWDFQGNHSQGGHLLEGRYIRRSFESPVDGETRTDAANILWAGESGEGRLSQQVRADLTTEETVEVIKEVEYAGPGAGRYDSLGVYTGEGDYDVVLKPSGDRRLERRMEASWRLDLAPGRGGAVPPGGGGLRRLWRSSQWLLYLTGSARTAGSAADFWNRLPTLLAGSADGVPLSSFRLRGEASALPESRVASPRIRMERERSRSNEYLGLQTRRSRDLLSLSIRSVPGRGITLEQEIQSDREEEWTRRTDSEKAGVASGWDSLRGRSSAWLRVGGEWTLRVAGSARRRERADGSRTILVTQATPGLQWSAPPRARMDLSATRTWLDGSPGSLPGLEKAGWAARGQFSLRVRSYLDASVQLDIDDPDSGRSVTGGRAELRANF